MKIVVLAVPYAERYILLYAEAGITDYVPREASIDELIEVVFGAAKGWCYCRLKIAPLLSEGLLNKQIVRHLSIEVFTVKNNERP